MRVLLSFALALLILIVIGAVAYRKHTAGRVWDLQQCPLSSDGYHHVRCNTKRCYCL